jgi:hypothetical protein
MIGDNLQFACVLKQLKKFAPDLHIGVEAREGAHFCFEGIADECYALKHPFTWQAQYPPENRSTIKFRRPENGWINVPSTKVSQCLQDMFPEILPDTWDLNCFKYTLNIPEEVEERVDKFLKEEELEDFGLIHSRGTAIKKQKDLSSYEEAMLANILLSQDITPVLLDWNNECKWADDYTEIKRINHKNQLWFDACGNGGNPQVIAELGNRAAVCYGIDSGPAHVWGAIDTPTYVIWIGTHPCHCYDLADNVTHLVPSYYPKMGSCEASAFFQKYYNHHIYGKNIEEYLAGMEGNLYCEVPEELRDERKVEVEEVWGGVEQFEEPEPEPDGYEIFL